MTDHRQLGVDLFNEVWRLLETREDDDRMLHAAHASRFHWGEAVEAGPANLARGEWQVSRVYVALGRAEPEPEPAVWHAERCLEHCERAGLGDRDLAYAHEALARAHALAGQRSGGRVKAKAREAGDAIADPLRDAVAARLSSGRGRSSCTTRASPRCDRRARP